MTLLCAFINIVQITLLEDNDMNREYEIGLAADEYCATTDPVLINCGGYSFMEGAKWADKHPINLWHKVDEEPSKDTYILIETSFFKDDLEYYSHCWSASSAPSWEEYVKDCDVKRWIYLCDLV